MLLELTQKLTIPWLPSLTFVLFSIWVYYGTLLASSHAGERHQLPNAQIDYPFSSRSQSLEDALKYFGKNINVKVSVDETLSGTVLDTGRVRHSRVSYLKQLAAEHDFVWFYDGVVLHVAPVSTIQTEAISLKNNDGGDIIRLLRQLNVLQQKFTHKIDDRNSVLVVTGPGKYVEIVKRVVVSIEQGKRKKLSVLRGDTSLELPPLVTSPSSLGSAPAQALVENE